MSPHSFPTSLRLHSPTPTPEHLNMNHSPKAAFRFFPCQSLFTSRPPPTPRAWNVLTPCSFLQSAVRIPSPPSNFSNSLPLLPVDSASLWQFFTFVWLCKPGALRGSLGGPQEALNECGLHLTVSPPDLTWLISLGMKGPHVTARASGEGATCIDVVAVW